MEPLAKSYDYVSFSLADATTDYDVKANQANLFSNVPVARRMIIFTTQDISFKINDDSFPAVNLDLGDQPFQSPENFMEIHNIFLTNSSGSASTVKIWLI